MAIARTLIAAAIALVASAIVALGCASPAAAHNSQIGSSPAAGAVLKAAPDLVSVRFDAGLMDVGEALVVRAADGTIVSIGVPEIKRDTIRTAVRTDVPAGEYTVAYRIVSKDGHPVSATFTYLVTVGAAASPSPRPAKSAAASTSPAPATPIDPATTASDSGPAVIIYVLIAVVIAGAGIALVLRSRR
jgi:methionine-rich copper-binding protein CopC